MPRASSLGRTAHLVVLSLWAGCTRPNPEFTGDGGGRCTPGARRCQGSLAEVCGPSRVFQADRTCPSGSTCTAGVCTPDPSARRCAAPGGCPDGSVCTVFVDPATPGALATFCAPGVGGQAPGSSCASNQECASGLCVGERPSAICFQACAASTDCPRGLQCEDVSVTVDGVRGQGLKGCLSRRR
jgi:hypothetical protein